MRAWLLAGYALSHTPMSAPKFNTPDGPPRCPDCGESIRYQERCRVSGVWKHQACAAGVGTLPHMLATVEELCGGDDELTKKYCLAIVACMNMGTVEKASEISGLDLAFVKEVLRPLEENGVYKDGTWYYDAGVDLDDPQHCAIQVVMWVLCSKGEIVRHADPADPSVP